MYEITVLGEDVTGLNTNDPADAYEFPVMSCILLASSIVPAAAGARMMLVGSPLGYPYTRQLAFRPGRRIFPRKTPRAEKG